MSKTFLISDTHFGHEGVCKFIRKDGTTKLRPWSCAQEMDEDMISYWNKTVSPKDKVYHLGDVVMARRFLELLPRLNGDKVLIKGNHDIFKPEEYLKYFRDIRGCHVLDKLLLTHIPVHPDSKGRFRGNVHGHTHDYNIGDPWYYCVSVEQTDYRPVDFEVVRDYFRKLHDGLTN